MNSFEAFELLYKRNKKTKTCAYHTILEQKGIKRCEYIQVSGQFRTTHINKNNRQKIWLI